MSESKPYIPIDCNFYDRLEAWSVQKEEVHIQQIGVSEKVTGIIKDLYIKEKVEYLLLDSGVEVRLDTIAAVNDIPLEGACEI